MRTVTEFPGVVLRLALTAQKSLTEQGKTPEELVAALGEQFKLEAERAQHLCKALAMVEAKSPGHPERISRVRIFAGEDATKAPSGAQQDGDHFYLVELTALPAKASGKNDREERGGRRGKKGGKRGEKGDRGDRGPRRDRQGDRQARGPRPGAPSVAPVKPVETKPAAE